MQEIFRAFEAEIDSVLEGERAVVARINTAAVDRFRTVIDPLGCDVSGFNKTRSVLWNHGKDNKRGEIPIGQGWAKVRRSERDIIAKTKFDNDEFSSMLFDKYKSGSMNAWSIRAQIREASPPTKEEIRARPDLEDCETIYRKWDLIEYSATPTPGNSDCISLMVSRALIARPEWYVEPEPAPLEQIIENVPELVKAMIRTERWVDAADGFWYVAEPTGERIAKFRSSADAEECIRSMAASRSFETILVGLHTEQRVRFEQQKDDLLAEIALRQWGVI